MVHRSKMEAFVDGGPAAREELLIKRLTSRLDLDGNQREQIRPIVHETHTAIKQIRQQSRPQVEALLEESQRRITAILRPDQRQKFDQLIAERKGHGRHGEGPP
jgi:Spy/CpxP family protein refolding chaperone